MKDGSFRRITGLREHIDVSGSFIIRRVEIKKEPGKSLGFYIREGDGWSRKTGIFVSKINLGSIVDINRLLNAGDEIIRINDVDVTALELDDVVLIMQYIQKIILTVKVLRGVTDTLHCLKERRKRRELPKTPSFLEKDKRDRNKNTANGSMSSRELDLSVEDDDAAAKKTMPITHQVQNSKTESETIKVDIHPYDEVNFDSAAKDGYRAQSKKQSPSPPPGASHNKGKRKDINPYSKISLASVSALQNPDKAIDDINPYAQISSELRARLVSAKTDSNKPASSSYELDPINPYSEVRLRPHAKSTNPSEASAKPNRRLVYSNSEAGDEIDPYAQVSKDWKDKLTSSRTAQLDEEIGNHNVKHLESHASSSCTEEKPADDSNRLSFILQSNTLPTDQMNLEGLLDIIKSSQFAPRSPVVRKSFILDDAESEDPILDPSHIYAEVDRSKKQSSGENKGGRYERTRITFQPTSPPKSPVPFESGGPDDALPVILPAGGEDSLLPSGDKKSLPLTGHKK